MRDSIYVGLDVHKSSITVALAESGRQGDVLAFEGGADVQRRQPGGLEAIAVEVDPDLPVDPSPQVDGPDPGHNLPATTVLARAREEGDSCRWRTTDET